MSRANPAIDITGLGGWIRDIPDYPKPGVLYKDITPLLLDPEAFSVAIDGLQLHVADHAGDRPVDKVVGIEARGFILAAPLALRLRAGFVPARKAGKLPGATNAVAYDLEYGTETLEIHQGAIEPGDRVWIIDDVLATGGTAKATASLVEGFGGQVIGLGFLLEIGILAGSAALTGYPHASLVHA